MKTLLLAAGRGPSETDAPPLLAEQPGGGLLVEQLVALCGGAPRDLICAIRADHARRFQLAQVIAMAAPGAVVITIAGEPRGAACSALLCIQHIDPDDEFLVVSCNEKLDIDYAHPVAAFRAQGLDAGVITFPSLHPRYSYVRVDGNGLVQEAAEKRPISRMAIAGMHWFRRGGDFLRAAMGMIAKDAHVDGLFYISLVLNELVLEGKRIGTYKIAAAQYRPLKTVRQVDQFEHTDHAAAA